MKNESNKESMLMKFQALVKKQEESKDAVHSHFAMCFECGEEGNPHGQLIKMDASPIKALGMVEQAMFELKSVKKRIKKSMDDDRKRDSIPDEIKDAFIKFKDRLKEAIEKGDVEELQKLKQEIKEDYLARTGRSIENDSDEEKPFDINDFKDM